MAAGEDWTREEVEAIVSSYRGMLLKELAGLKFNKREQNRAVQSLTGRSPGSVEMKHQNISAALRDAGFPYIKGYKPLGNCQAQLRVVVAERLVVDEELNALVSAVVEKQQHEPSKPRDLLSIETEAPERDKKRGLYAPSSFREENRVVFPRNYAEIEARNRNLGLAGERLILEYEHERLWRAGERKLAEKIEHLSAKGDDRAGYDIHSFELDGRDRLIEVKTTQFGKYTAFFASRNEVECSQEKEANYQLYRVYDFAKEARFFPLRGAIGATCELTASTFLAVPR